MWQSPRRAAKAGCLPSANMNSEGTHKQVPPLHNQPLFPWSIFSYFTNPFLVMSSLCSLAEVETENGWCCLIPYFLWRSKCMLTLVTPWLFFWLNLTNCDLKWNILTTIGWIAVELATDIQCLSFHLLSEIVNLLDAQHFVQIFMDHKFVNICEEYGSRMTLSDVQVLPNRPEPHADVSIQLKSPLCRSTA